MSSILHGAGVYLVLLLIFRIAGKRTLSEITTFDFVLLLIISEAVQQGMIGEDNSMTNAMLVVVTLVGLDVGFSLLKRHFPRLERMVDPSPVVIVADGVLQREAAQKERVDEDDVLSAARTLHGLERMDQVKHAVLETGGKISIIPRERE
ncbi:MAG: hypothetical protein JWL60_797 [Gemmatimonadetes bacterium]|jgi:uncharacterized membrane protein YcaP (DUF421 family)|nr:hypothetical protein [Gemmatimonadota bacterium]